MGRARLGWIALAGFTAASFLWVPTALAWWLGPSEWPVERLARNVEAYLAEHPDEPEARYVLGRIHALAFELESQALAIRREPAEGALPVLHADDVQEWYFSPAASRRKPGDRPNPSQRLEHLEGAVRNLVRATQLSPQRAECELTLACVLEGGAPLASQLDTVELLLPSPPELAEGEAAEIRARTRALAAENASAEAELRDELERAVPLLNAERGTGDEKLRLRIAGLLELHWRERAIAGFRRAFELAIEAELRGGFLPESYLMSKIDLCVSFEAGQSWTRLVRQRGIRDAAEEAFLVEIANKLKGLEKLRPNDTISPILLALEDCRTLDGLIRPEVAVPFDLDGDGVDELWPWIAPGTGWLVWDPEQRGTITSGAQLFGDRSGWFFFPDGYRVLDALDDDRSGELRGAELQGIAVWFDRDSDGVSDRGEVVPVEALGIVALATEATLRIGASPANLCGLELADGRILPTYDWVLAPTAGS